MKNFFLSPILIFCGLFIACNTTTPENYFDITVLNCNMMRGFANDELQRELDNPTVKTIDGSKDQFAPVKRREIIESKIKYLEENMKKIKLLKETEDTKDILRASLALNEYVLPVYKSEYQQLAKLYDNGAAKEEIQSLSQAIHDKYYSKFGELFSKLVAAGKPYAEKNNIKVNWDISTTPQ